MRDCEERLTALETLFGTIPGIRISRNKAQADAVHPGGELILWDGSGEQAEYVIGAPQPYLWAWSAKLQVMVEAKTTADRDSAFDTLCGAIGDKVIADRTLGGLCDWVEAAAPEITELIVEGAPAFKGGEIAITFTYASANPTG